MKDQFLPYESCRMLKELGFNEECFVFYNGSEGGLVYPVSAKREHMNEEWERTFIAPLYQQVKQWLWEKHQMHIKHEMVSDDCFEYYIRIKMSQLVKYSDSRAYKSPVIAEREGIKAAIEYIYENTKSK